MSTHPATTPESATVEALLDALRQADAPRTAKQLREELTIPKPPAAAKLGTLLEDQVASGEVARFDPLTGKTPRYWLPGRDEHAGLRARAMAALRDADGPRTAAELLKELPDAQVKAPGLARLLEEQADAGAVVRFAPLKGNLALYWTPGREEHEGIRAAVLEALRGADGPMTAAEVLKALPDPKPKAPKLTQLLEEQVAAEAVARFDPLKGTAARYWTPGREEHEGVVDSLLAAIRDADGPRTAAELVKAALPGANKSLPARAAELLERQVAAGVLHRFPPASATGAARYSDRGPEQFERAAVRKAIAKGEEAKKPLTFPQLHKALKGTTEDRASELLQDMLDAGEVHKVLKFDKKADQYATQPPDLRAYLEADFAAIYARFEAAGVSREQVDEAARACLGAPAAAPTSAPIPVAPRPAEDAADLAAAVLEVFEELRREKYGHTGMVPIHEIRRGIAGRLGPAAARHDALDEAIKRLGRERLRMLPINDASHVSAEELNDSIRGLNETWFYLEAKA